MSHVPHELSEEFPEEAQKIHELKQNNPRFSKLTDDYHEVNRKIHRIESEIEATSDAFLEDLKKKRLSLKDEVSAFLK